MADIYLSIGIDEDKIDYKELNDSVSTIAENLAPIKVNIDINQASLDTAKETIESIYSTVRDIGTIQIEFVGDDLRQITSRMDSISDTTRRMEDGIDSLWWSLNNIIGKIKSIIDALPEAESALSKMSKNGSVGFDQIEENLKGVLDLVNQINSKDFNISNMFEVKNTKRTSSSTLELYRDQANELILMTNQLANTIGGLVNNQFQTFQNMLSTGVRSGDLNSNILVDFWSRYTNFTENMDKYTASIATVSTSGSLVKNMKYVQQYYDMFVKIANVAQKQGYNIQLPDTTRYDELTEQLRGTGKQADQTAQAIDNIANAATKVAGQTATQELSKTTETQSNSIKGLCSEASELLDQLRAKIEETFNLATVSMNEESIYSVIDQIKERLSDVTIDITRASVSGAVDAPSVTTKDSITSTSTSEGVSDLKGELNGVSDAAISAAESLRMIVSAVEDVMGAIRGVTTDAKELPAVVEDAASATDDLVEKSNKLENAVGVYERLNTQSKNVKSDYKRVDQLNLEYDEIQELNTAYEKYISALDDMKNTDVADRTQEQADAIKQYHDEVEVLITKINARKQAEDEAVAAAEAAAKAANTNSQEQINNYKAQIKQIQNYQKALQSTYSSMFKAAGGSSATGESAQELTTMRDKLVETDTAIQSMNQHLDTMTQDEINSIQQLQAEIQDVINMSQERQAAEQAATEEIINGIRSEYATIKTEYDTLIKDLNSASATDINTEDVENLKVKYEELTNIVNKYKKSTTGINEDEIKSTQDLINELNDLINKTQEQVNAEKEKAEAAAKAAKEQEEAERRAADEEQRAAAARDKAYSTITKLENTMRQYSAAAKSSNQASREAYEALGVQAEKVRQARKEYDDGRISIDDFESVLKEANATLAKSKSIITEAGDNVQALGDRIGSVAQKFSTWLTTSRFIMEVVKAIKQLVSASIELDSAMGQLRIVTNETEASYAKFSDTISKTAQNIGASITDLVDATTTYARLGYSLEESSSLAEYTAMLQNVGDIDTEDAQNAVTAIIKAFNISVDDIEEVMDKLVVVGNNFPISVSEIATGLNNTASTMAAAGNSFEETVALLTAANTVMQDVSKSSTGLRTITARIRNTKTELDDLGIHKICPAA